MYSSKIQHAHECSSDIHIVSVIGTLYCTVSTWPYQLCCAYQPTSIRSSQLENDGYCVCTEDFHESADQRLPLFTTDYLTQFFLNLSEIWGSDLIFHWKDLWHFFLKGQISHSKSILIWCQSWDSLALKYLNLKHFFKFCFHGCLHLFMTEEISCAFSYIVM